MEVKIVSCSKPGVWYEDRIGQVFDVYLEDGYYVVNRNGLFRIRECDVEDITVYPIRQKTMSENIIDILSEKNKTSIDIYMEYKRDILNSITKPQILSLMTRMHQKKKIEPTSIKSRGLSNNHKKYPLWKITGLKNHSMML